MTGQEILAEADVLVPNAFTTQQKIDWLNDVQREFFEVVKVPGVYSFAATAGQNSVTLPTGVVGRNIVMVMVGTTQYRPVQYDDGFRPGLNYYTFDDTTRQLTFNPPPAVAGQGLIRYFRVPTQTFTSANLSQQAEAPAEYHEALVLGLAMRIAKAQNDVALGNNYMAEYMAMLQVAQQNFNLNNIAQGNLPQRIGGQ